MTKRRILFWIGCLTVVLLAGCAPKGGREFQKVCFGNNCVSVEVARTDEDRMKGLMKRPSLARDRGMLFIFDESRPYAFWMKNTYIPLDMVWLDAERRVVTVISNVLPCKTEKCPVYEPTKSALYVLEVNAGVTLEWGVKAGDRAEFIK